MNILLAISPFVGFALVNHLAGPLLALAVGAGIALALVLRDALSAGRSVKLLELATLALFTAMTLYAFVADPQWSVMGVRLAVDGGLFLICLISLLIGRPFTLQYARDELPAERLRDPRVLRTNMVISSVWTLAFGVLVAADAAMLSMPDTMMRPGILVTIAALVIAVKFTKRYRAA
jgi:hypothetical protein